MVTVYAWDGAGAPLWVRTVPSDAACNTGIILYSTAYGSDRLVTLGGQFFGTMMVGADRGRPESSDGWVVEFSP